MQKPEMDPQFWEDLAQYNPIGMKMEAVDAKAWFETVWLRYRTYGYKNHAKAIASWWSRVSREDIEASRLRARTLANEEIEAEAQRIQPSNVVPIDYFARIKHG